MYKDISKKYWITFLQKLTWTLAAKAAKRSCSTLGWLSDFAVLFLFFGLLGTAASLSDKLFNSRNLASASFCLVSHSSLQLSRNISKSENYVCNLLAFYFFWLCINNKKLPAKRLPPSKEKALNLIIKSYEMSCARVQLVIKCHIPTAAIMLPIQKPV